MNCRSGAQDGEVLAGPNLWGFRLGRENEHYMGER